MVKDLASGVVLLAQAITMPYDGVWQLGDKCDITKTDDMLTISEGRVIGTGFACFYDSIKQRAENIYVVISRCYEGTNPAKYMSYSMKVDPNNIWIYNSETGKLHSTLARCNG